MLHHPNSSRHIKLKDFRSRRINLVHINCGYTYGFKNGFRESTDFFPNYSSYNNIMFESSVILTAWEHATTLFKSGPVCVLHTDIWPKFPVSQIVDMIETQEAPFVVGLTVPSHSADKFNDLLIEDTSSFRYELDPWHVSRFDGVVDIWELIRIVDPEVYEFACFANPLMIYSHQFVADRKTFDSLCLRLAQVALNLRLGQCGLWSPHVFERIIAVRLAMLAQPKLAAAFSHESSSGPKGKGLLTLYGPRSYKHFRMRSRLMDNSSE